jgi:hypothetical protein
VSIHGGTVRDGLEHVATTDRGIIMMRNMLRRGIRAVGGGEDLGYTPTLWKPEKSLAIQP